MTDERLYLPKGTLDLLILKALSLGSRHGWAISERLHPVSRATLQVPLGVIEFWSDVRHGLRAILIGTSSSGSWTSSCAFTSRARPGSAWLEGLPRDEVLRRACVYMNLTRLREVTC